MADFLSLLTQIPTLMAAFGGDVSAPYRRQQENLSRQMESIGNAQADINNPLYQHLYGQYNQQNQRNLAQGVAELQAQNRMNTANGRTPLFDPSRGGEQIFRNLMQGYQNSGVQSDQQTRQALQGAANSYAGAYGGYGGMSARTGAANLDRLNVGYQGIYNMLNQGRGNTQNQNTNNNSNLFDNLRNGAMLNPNVNGRNMGGVGPTVQNATQLGYYPQSSYGY